MLAVRDDQISRGEPDSRPDTDEIVPRRGPQDAPARLGSVSTRTYSRGERNRGRNLRLSQRKPLQDQERRQRHCHWSYLPDLDALRTVRWFARQPHSSRSICWTTSSSTTRSCSSFPGVWHQRHGAWRRPWNHGAGWSPSKHMIQLARSAWLCSAHWVSGTWDRERMQVRLTCCRHFVRRAMQGTTILSERRCSLP
jgi:hypothetical protein